MLPQQSTKVRKESLIQEGLELYVQIHHPVDKIGVMTLIKSQTLLNLQILFVIPGKLDQLLQAEGKVKQEEIYSED